MVQSSKVVLRNFDDKIYTLTCGIHSRPHGHSMNKVNDNCQICNISESVSPK